MIHTDGILTIANHGSERLLEAKKASKKTASERIRAARAKADREGGFDLEVADHGSLILIRARTTTGQEWLDENLGGDVQYWGDSVACEPRYVDDVLAGAKDYGLNVSG